MYAIFPIFMCGEKPILTEYTWRFGVHNWSKAKPRRQYFGTKNKQNITMNSSSFSYVKYYYVHIVWMKREREKNTFKRAPERMEERTEMYIKQKLNGNE